MIEKVEKYIDDYTRNCSNELCSIQDKYGKQIISYNEWLTPNNARRTAEIAKEETIKKAWDWIDYNNRNGGCNFDGWEEDFKNYMKGE